MLVKNLAKDIIRLATVKTVNLNFRNTDDDSHSVLRDLKNIEEELSEMFESIEFASDEDAYGRLHAITEPIKDKLVINLTIDEADDNSINEILGQLPDMMEAKKEKELGRAGDKKFYVLFTVNRKVNNNKAIIEAKWEEE